jgi:hypothetical protein
LKENSSLTHPTLEQLRQLGLAGMARAFEELADNARGAELDHAEWLGPLLDRELADRQDRRLRARLRYATHACATAPPSRMSITAPRVTSIARRFRSWHKAAGSRNSRT